MTEETPQYRHDCERCKFLGRYGQSDLYYCDSATGPTVMDRFGNKGPECYSGLYVAGARPDVFPGLAEAKRRAIAAGHLPPEVEEVKKAAIKTWKERTAEWLASGRTNVIYPHHKETAMLEEIAELRAALDKGEK